MIGAGTIGQLAARVLALRGHAVTVFDRERARLGFLNGGFATSESVEGIGEFDWIIEATGDQAVLSTVLERSATGATMLLMGLPYASQSFSFESIVSFDRSIIGTVGSSGADFDESLRTLPLIDTKPFLDVTLPLTDFERAWGLVTFTVGPQSDAPAGSRCSLDEHRQRAKELYDRSPVAVQNLLITAYSAKLDRQRYHGRFAEFQALLLQMESAAEVDIRAYQDTQLRQLVEHAYRTVPYYTRTFNELGLKPADIQTVADLPRLPLMTKAILKANFNDLWSRAFERRELVDGHTSGTTGTPLEVLYDRGMMAMSYAALDRQYRWAGCRLKRFGDRVAVLRGNIIVPLAQRRPPFWRVNWYHNQLLLSNFHLSPEKLPVVL